MHNVYCTHIFVLYIVDSFNMRVKTEHFSMTLLKVILSFLNLITKRASYSMPTMVLKA